MPTWVRELFGGKSKSSVGEPFAMTEDQAYAVAVHAAVGEFDRLGPAARRVSTFLLQATPLVQLGEVQRLPVCDVLARAAVSFSELESALSTLVQRHECCSRQLHAVLQNAQLTNNDAEVVFRVCPRMARVMRDEIDALSVAL